MNWIIDQLLKFTGSQNFLSMQLDITNTCNLHCTHCYQPTNNDGLDLPLEKWCEILNQYDALSAKLHLRHHFTLSGGEPTISSLFIPFLELLRSRFPDAGINILTNGTMISDEMVRAIKLSGADVQVSIDGPNSELHDSIRGRGNFQKAVCGIMKLRANGVHVVLQAVLSRQTVPFIPSFFDMAERLDVAMMNFTRFIPQGRGKILQQTRNGQMLGPLELRDAYASILESAARSKVRTATNLPLFVLLEQGLGAHGKAGFQGLVIDHLGNLKVTSRADFILGNIFAEGLENLFLRHPIMNQLRAGHIRGCGSCRFYDRCGGDRNASYVVHGSFMEIDPGCWLEM